MVFTIEPGIYIPEEKLGVRIEDMSLRGRQRQTDQPDRGTAPTRPTTWSAPWRGSKFPNAARVVLAF